MSLLSIFNLFFSGRNFLSSFMFLRAPPSRSLSHCTLDSTDTNFFFIPGLNFQAFFMFPCVPLSQTVSRSALKTTDTNFIYLFYFSDVTTFNLPLSAFVLRRLEVCLAMHQKHQILAFSFSWSQLSIFYVPLRSTILKFVSLCIRNNRY